jgi:mannose-6-phosphate isomerase-like protein (cupin superfamily)
MPGGERLRPSCSFLAAHSGERFGFLEPNNTETRRSAEPKVRGSNPLGRALAETQRGPAGWRLNSRIAAVPFTLRNLKGDLEDLGSNFDGAPDLEFRFASKALELEQSGLSYQRIPPDYRFPYGHTHKEQEEVYVVVRGSGRMKLDEEIVEVKEWDVVRVPPGTWRGYEGGPEGLEILVFGAPNLGENPRDDVEGQRDWWAD